jgi:chromosome partitioning protein
MHHSKRLLLFLMSRSIMNGVVSDLTEEKEAVEPRIRMNTTLVVNPKGGAGKTTVAINLASHFAACNTPTTLMDYDPQGCSMHWLRLRAPHAATIYSANAVPERRDRLRSFEMYVPPHTRQLVIDAPAGASGLLLQEMLDRSNCILVPVVPSPIDLHTTANFIRDLLSYSRLRSGRARLGVVANKVRRSMPAYRPLEAFLYSLNLRLLARLIDSDTFLRTAESGVGIFEMDENLSISERQQFAPIVEWIEGRGAQRDSDDGVVFELVRRSGR